MSRETSSADLPNSVTTMPKAGEERGGEMGEARDSLGVSLNDPSNQHKRASSVNIEDLDSEAGQAQKRMKGNSQEGGDSGGKDSSGSSSRSRWWSRQEGSGIHQYVRPLHPRVYCRQCTECPDGFRSDHELHRHTKREHPLTRKAWVIKDISEDKKFLSKCEACVSGKRYGQDYNAAAHLRRRHFSERKVRQQGGGDKEQSPPVKAVKPPSMQELRSWIEEVEVTAETPPPESPQPPEGGSAQQESATVSKEAAGDPTHSGGQDDIALANRPASELFLNSGQSYFRGWAADCGIYDSLQRHYEYSAASGAPTLIDAFAQSADTLFPQPHHPPKAIFPNPSATTGKGHRGHILGGGWYEFP